ncbi:MAG: hypothetical protein OXE94_14055 [Aestuariivita sp.]|nr:hypothetical protein [Aestuariivita sp.]MCY4202294.1 hypothetical protein [Aestuariivita sp.]
MRNLKDELDSKRGVLLAEWEAIKATDFLNLKNAAAKINHELPNRIQIEVIPAGNREPLFEHLGSEVGGRMSEAVESLTTASEFSIIKFVAACRLGPDTLHALYGIPPRQAKRICDSNPETLMQVEGLELSTTVAIRLNTAHADAPSSWQSLEHVSTGQIATAVLLLLLLQSDAPLIIDQPEDDLDNRFINEGIVPRLGEEKQSRQFIFTTHNANIPVLGDAELIVGLSNSEGRAFIAPEHTGAIDSKSVRELVEDILEGGRDAFEARQRKYGF